MPVSLEWLPDVLKSTGLKVAVVDGWQNRGRGEMGTIEGVICHHTAGPRNGNMPSLRILKDGRPGLSGPLAQLGLGRDGTFYVIAAGRANHAGAGRWREITDGNGHFIGIEAENTGLPNDVPWPDIQMQSYRAGVAAILKHIGKGAESCAGHKEYALPPGRKSDPDFDMKAFRAAVAQLLEQDVPALALIPAIESGDRAGKPARMTIRRGDRGPLVEQIQSACGLAIDGRFGPKTEAFVRAIQRSHGLVADGIVGPKTWTTIDLVAGE